MQLETQKQTIDLPPQPSGPERRRRVWLALLAIVVIVSGLFLVVHARQGAGVQLQGTNLGGTPAPKFSLQDQTGAKVSLQQFHGHPVVVTFLFTHCPDVCPLTADKLNKTAQSLGGSANSVGWLAVSVDPVGDTPASAKDFVAQHGLTGRLHFLLGSPEQLAPIWHDYFIGVKAQLESSAASGSIAHTIGVFVIDQQGNERVHFDDGFDPAILSKDLRLLLQE